MILGVFPSSPAIPPLVCDLRNDTEDVQLAIDAGYAAFHGGERRWVGYWSVGGSSSLGFVPNGFYSIFARGVQWFSVSSIRVAAQGSRQYVTLSRDEPSPKKIWNVGVDSFDRGDTLGSSCGAVQLHCGGVLSPTRSHDS